MSGTPPVPTDSPQPPEAELRPIHALVQGLIDYAGLFPPAKLSMDESVANYAKYLRSEHSWMLGRFICPVSRLEEFRRSSQGLLPRAIPDAAEAQHAGHAVLMPDTHGHHADQPWPISALIDGDLEEDLDAVFAFNHEHGQAANGLAVIDAVEIKVPAEGAALFIDQALESIPEETFPFFEIAVQAEGGGVGATGDAEPDFRGLIAALSGSDAGAKVRTGGLTPGAFPSPERIAEFIAACDAADVPFKATAGLHHPVRGEHALTYEPGSARGVMHGFLNVFAAAALIRMRKITPAMAADVLRETDPRALAFSEGEMRYRSMSLDALEIGVARETFALSFGSCSFEEPVEELGRLGLV